MEEKEKDALNEKEAEVDKKRVEEYFQKKLEKNEYKIQTTFKKIKNLYSDDIIPKIIQYNRVITNSIKSLNGEETDEKGKINLKKIKLKLKELKKSKTVLNLQGKSEEKMEILRRKINYHVNKVKKSHEDLTALNALYLDNSLFTTKNNNKSISINRSGIFFNPKENKSLNYEEAINNKNLRNNFVLNSNLYHKQLNNAFIKYNPVIHLNNLKILAQLSPIVREDITKIKLDVDEDIKQIQNKINLKKLKSKDKEEIKKKKTRNIKSHFI